MNFVATSLTHSPLCGALADFETPRRTIGKDCQSPPPMWADVLSVAEGEDKANQRGGTFPGGTIVRANLHRFARTFSFLDSPGPFGCCDS